MANMNKSLGFTLMELLIAVAIIGILASVAYPSYTSFLLRSDRSEALRELVRIANLQEQLYSDSRAYTADMTKLGLGADPYVTSSGYYSIDATVSGATFVLTATALGKQAKDTDCKKLTINQAGAKTPATGCWEQ